MVSDTRRAAPGFNSKEKTSNTGKKGRRGSVSTTLGGPSMKRNGSGEQSCDRAPSAHVVKQNSQDLDRRAEKRIRGERVVSCTRRWGDRGTRAGNKAQEDSQEPRRGTSTELVCLNTAPNGKNQERGQHLQMKRLPARRREKAKEQEKSAATKKTRKKDGKKNQDTKIN